MAKVVVAMSGGVDSSVAAALLKEQGHDVIGLMLRLWSQPGKESENACCTLESVSLAEQVARRFDIPFNAVDAKDAFRNTVVDYFLESYQQGETPNPCLMCNRHIRWGVLREHALALGADFIASGHYVRLQRKSSGEIQLLRGFDRGKDQAYVLHVLTQVQLRQSLFPVGGYPKSEIRELARKFDLPVAAKADSQDLCFLSGGDYRNFLKEYAPQTTQIGEIVTRDGKVLGEHQGLAFYTIGQRKGLNVTASEPLYVLAKNVTSNQLMVGTADELGSREMDVEKINWISGEAAPTPFRAQVKIRYAAKEAWAEIAPTGPQQAHVTFDTPQRDITPGQAAVFYEDEICLGGGAISSSKER
ncbi:MAG: tRNA 2-thiouridine(34) synthase MnmA [Anaerolineae bacterium]|jgi:tRNA-uridine 2-sulfurtransferase|nr:tRNA 2-thiouridine(34) synthase MnmA [Anaerolineae bacterium]MBT7069986.1 tRNA 2-thiouridine(34) synthase MnmA [Anaerolineae bacterium]MBT7325694.1 tRNA 2-thiouridine(34) synthase MnmA [Anaerolineae bacterium]